MDTLEEKNKQGVALMLTEMASKVADVIDAADLSHPGLSTDQQADLSSLKDKLEDVLRRLEGMGGFWKRED